MAIKKDVKMKNGVILNYHRIALIDIDINQQITLLVESYVDEDGRDYMKAYKNGEIEGEPSFPYMEGTYFYLDYDESLCLFKSNIIEQAYELIKTYPQFQGAEDI